MPTREAHKVRWDIARVQRSREIEREGEKGLEASLALVVAIAVTGYIVLETPREGERRMR